MARITQTKKRKPLADGELHSIGANTFVKGEGWKNFSIGIRQPNDNPDHAVPSTYTTMHVDRAEAQRIVNTLARYLCATTATGPES